ncbi:hypothetical protein J2795_003543 [Chryseobacterium bernardetii]|jgi:hypothetical protein|uniref:Uncharacterized protein n=3 Tax=Chryseobacterium TaxID=59732 RepID=A0A543EC89_9FLAO|nr:MULTISPECIES: hypothetical protein [Chryseobacterium]MDR6372598.1 hypothetical protein [Chryseobacterium vietnamense]MDR6442816.1 hypothetical protein [Chryseobacterium bernardetii]MDR6460140.1 hypothetical protein [Chryseobacterium vietnamense]MDR6488923.1 hypothetical protein [Chryseobacterium vietnamense]TQM19208.1 hypothetical protein FB551_3603 [Chryseobacterium aquifrigidense]
MKASVLLKSSLLTSLFVITSCATTKYSEDISKNNYSNLEAGKVYKVTMRDGSPKQTILFRNVVGENIVGTAGKKDSTEVIIPKANVAAVKDRRKARIAAGATIIGAAGVAAIVLSSSRAD